jgi:hypothetical protein
MKITTRWWIACACAGALACEESEVAAGHEEAAITDEVGEVCEAEADEACAGLALDLASDGHCGNHPSALEVAAVEVELGERMAAAQVSPGARATIPVYVHVIHDAAGNGNVSDQRIAQQIAKLNEGFAGTGFSFSLAGVTRTANSTWYLMSMDSAAERQAKRALRRGGAGTLNMYVVDAVGFLGWATFPWMYPFDPRHDGIVVDHATLPGGSVAGFSGGTTAVHEVGHWLGLFHTFQSGCSLLGDAVSDTPAEQSPASGCPVGRDTCQSAGVDPIHNYMDYSNDTCRNTFTAGQRSRMAWSYTLFR